MPVIADTAYPRLPTQPGPVELEAFTPGAAEVAFASQRTRQPGPRLALLVLLKTFQHLGRVVRLADVPAAVLAHVAASASLADALPGLAGYDDTTYRVRLATLVRGYAGVASYDCEARGVAARACIEAARTRDDLADIVNAGIEELPRCRRELPAFGALLRLARSARTLVIGREARRLDDLAFVRAAALWLDRQPQLGRDIFPRPHSRHPRVVSYMALMEGCLFLLRAPDEQPGVENEIYRPGSPVLFGVDEAMTRIRALVIGRGEGVAFEGCLPSVKADEPLRELRARAAVASSFVGVLELVRNGEVGATQTEQQGSIVLCGHV